MSTLPLFLAFLLKDSSMFFKYSLAMADVPTKIFGLSTGFQSAFGILQTKYEVGIMRDTRTDSLPFGYMSAGLGVEPQYGPIFFQFFQSVGTMTISDKYNGGYFQFMQDVGLGFKGSNNTSLAIGYKHISNLGLHQDNLGRDLINFTVRIYF